MPVQLCSTGISASSKARGLKVYMTATPEPACCRARREAVQLITIPVRHHGYPMPVPELVMMDIIRCLVSWCTKTTPQTKAGLNLSMILV